MEYVLTTDRLCKQYKHFKALNQLTMHVPKGAIYGFIGKNGAGKTTLIRLICGLQEPTSGEYSLYGEKNSGKGIGKMRRRMGSIVETPSIYLDMTARENLQEQYRPIGGLMICSGWSVWQIPAKRRRRISPLVCVSGSASPWRSQVVPIFSCSMSRSMAWTHRGLLRSGN